jgi:hypothetical protein
MLPYQSASKTKTRTQPSEHGLIATGSRLLVRLLEGQAVQKDQNSIETPSVHLTSQTSGMI